MAEVNNLLNLADIREYVTYLLESEQEGNAGFWTPKIINSFISAVHTRLTTKIHKQHENYFSKPQTADIVANQPAYALPAGFRHMRFLEARTEAGRDTWRPILPLEKIEDKDGLARPDGVGITEEIRIGAVQPQYLLQGGLIWLFPFFNQAMPDGLRAWFDFSPDDPADDTWVPFGGLLLDHHEILAVGAAIRCKKREEVPDQWGDLYRDLYASLIAETENRQFQRSRHGADNEGYY